MGRPLRIEFPGALYHITSRGNEKKEIYRDDLDRMKFLEILKDYHDRYGILIHSYILMDNHYHLILETPKGNLLKIMHGINGSYTGYFNRRHKRAGHLFQGRYKAILVDKDSYLVQLSRYIHLNPVRTAIVEKPQQYKWSSYQAYIGKDKEHKWVEYSWVLSTFGEKRKRARSKYQEYVEEVLKESIENPLKNLQGQILLGEDKFIEKIKMMLKGKDLSPEIAERKRLRRQFYPDEIIKAVAKVFKISGEMIKKKSVKDNSARKAAIYFTQRYSGLSNVEIGNLFGGIHFSAVSKASDRLKKDMAGDKKLSKLIEGIDSLFKA